MKEKTTKILEQNKGRANLYPLMGGGIITTI